MNPFRRFSRRGRFEKECEYIKCCPCKADKASYSHCKDCDYYRMIDSGHGNCIALPRIEVVPWCKISCSLYL